MKARNVFIALKKGGQPGKQMTTLPIRKKGMIHSTIFLMAAQLIIRK